MSLENFAKISRKLLFAGGLMSAVVLTGCFADKDKRTEQNNLPTQQTTEQGQTEETLMLNEGEEKTLTLNEGKTISVGDTGVVLRRHTCGNASVEPPLEECAGGKKTAGVEIINLSTGGKVTISSLTKSSDPSTGREVITSSSSYEAVVKKIPDGIHQITVNSSSVEVTSDGQVSYIKPPAEVEQTASQEEEKQPEVEENVENVEKNYLPIGENLPVEVGTFVIGDTGVTMSIEKYNREMLDKKGRKLTWNGFWVAPKDKDGKSLWGGDKGGLVLNDTYKYEEVSLNPDGTVTIKFSNGKWEVPVQEFKVGPNYVEDMTFRMDEPPQGITHP